MTRADNDADMRTTTKYTSITETILKQCTMRTILVVMMKVGADQLRLLAVSCLLDQSAP